jgi:hypothetical protein
MVFKMNQHPDSSMPKSASTSSDHPSHEEIARAAETIYERSGRISGRDVENWLAAEAQLIAERKASTQPKTAVKSPTRTPAAQNYARKGNA